MKIADRPINETALICLGAQAVQLLHAADFHTLASRFGYAVALGRDQASAISEDLSSILSQLQATAFQTPLEHSTSVLYLQENEAGLTAVVECTVPVNSGRSLLLELVVTSQGIDNHITLEQIGVAP